MSTPHRRVATRATAARPPLAIVKPETDIRDSVRVLTCGSVDDGKSTLIGRLLWDASDLFEDQRETLRKSPRRVLDGTHLDYSLLVDGLLAEREQGITIDIAWRYFDTADRRFVIIDSPGHTQYTRNMASGASHADVAIMLIDARHGIKSQTRRHAALLDLFGVRRVILAVNKMDLVGFSAARFREIEAELRALTWRFHFADAVAIPVAAVTGDNVATRSAAMRWYTGPTLLEQLGTNRAEPGSGSTAFRMPIQTVLRDGQDFRGLAGTIASGQISVGDEVLDITSGLAARVARIATMDGDLQTARSSQAIALVLDRDIDMSRGSILSSRQSAPTPARQLETRLIWLSETPFDPKTPYLLRTATDLVPISKLAINDLLDLETLAHTPAETCAVNDIASATLTLARATAVDEFVDQPSTGAFVLVDPITGATVAGGVVVLASHLPTPLRQNSSANIFHLTRALLENGVCADLIGKADTAAEFARRTQAVADLLRAAGVDVQVQ